MTLLTVLPLSATVFEPNASITYVDYSEGKIPMRVALAAVCSALIAMAPLATQPIQQASASSAATPVSGGPNWLCIVVHIPKLCDVK
ncbi:MAG: hypothetical protein LKI58_10520 [Actinomyces sp.]|jgi:hypothetical protein|nr:hypothetical protein [Actinomyces sp.]MCI1788474.1 hypothetical protein [Actinomyces sp.]MCI1831004.1 hypothetical protein [Actinomyces sp.]